MKYETKKAMYSKYFTQKSFFLQRSRTIILTIISRSLFELDLYFMNIYLCMKYEPNTPMISKDIARKPFSLTEIKGHNSDNNQWISSIIELDLYVIIIYLCMQNESNTSVYSKDIAWKPFFIRRSRANTLIINNGFYP